MLLLCTLACAWVRWKNLESGRLALEGKFSEARRVDKPNRWLTKLAVSSLALGIIFIGLFALTNLVEKVNVKERNIKMTDNKDEPKGVEEKKEIQKLSIPYGSVTPPEGTDQPSPDGEDGAQPQPSTEDDPPRKSDD
jgi:hypothetical protein